MEYETVVYTDSEGWMSVRRVEKGSLPSDYSTGSLLGPPDLAILGLEYEIERFLNNRLVEVGYVTYPDLTNNRRNLYLILEELLPEAGEDELRLLRNSVVLLYQQDYYPQLENR